MPPQNNALDFAAWSLVLLLATLAAYRLSRVLGGWAGVRLLEVL
jgi:hypothetical protein